MKLSPRPMLFDFCPRLILGCVAWATLLFGSVSYGAPRVPGSGSEVLEKLLMKPTDPAIRQIRDLQAKLSNTQDNADLACEVARLWIQQSRAETNPRYLGRAQAALSPWWTATNAPVPVLVLRGTIRQAQHEFRPALTDFDLALQSQPRNAQSWLNKVTVLTVLGEAPEARQACVHLAQVAPGLLALTAAANISSVTGDAERACGLLGTALESSPRSDIPERLWALTVLGETYARLGRAPDAETAFKSALALTPKDSYALGAYSDLLLDEDRPSEVISLLKDFHRIDGLLLRLAIAESRVDGASSKLKSDVETLDALFSAGQLRGDFLHQREQARFLLKLRSDPKGALNPAKKNWEIQHEPADVRLLLECAIAAGDLKAAEPAVSFVRRTGLQDVYVQKLLNKTQALAAK